jgi:hypothetical protein
LNQSEEYDQLQGVLSNKLSNMGENLSTAEINYITQKIHNHRRSNRLTLQLQAVAGGVPTTKNPVTNNRPAVQERKTPVTPTPQTQQDGRLRKVTTEINLGSRTPQNRTGLANQNSQPSVQNSLSSPKVQSREELPLASPKTNGPINYEKEYHFYKERCGKLEQVAKWLRDFQEKNKKLEAEVLQYQKGGAVVSPDKVNEIEKRYQAQLQKKTNEVKALRNRVEEVVLENEVLREQIADQNKLIDRLENGLQIAMDQVDYLTQQQSGAAPPVASKQTIMEEEEDIDYDDLDEETLTKLIAQTREALLMKRNSLSIDPYDDLEAY